jgi:hypothetical protein
MGCSVAGCCGACWSTCLTWSNASIHVLDRSIRPSNHAKGQVQIVMIVVINREKVDRDRCMDWLHG